MTASGPAEVYVCIVCEVAETQQDLLSTCDGCGELYHFNPRMTPGKDCGEAWIEDEEVGIQYFCRNCMDAARQQDQDRMEQLKSLVNSGGATPDTVAALMQSLGGAFATAAPTPEASGMPGMPMPGAAYAGFPGLAPGMPGAPVPPAGAGFPMMPGLAPMPGAGGLPDGIPAPIVLDPRDMPRGGVGTVADASPTADAPPMGSEAPPLLRRRPRGVGRRYRRIDE